MPFSLNQLVRIDRSIKPVDVITKFPGVKKLVGGDDVVSEYGQTYEFGPEFAGLFGFRAVELDPERSIAFKVADYQQGVRDSRKLFTSNTLKGGPVEPYEIIDAYINSNRALFGVRKEFEWGVGTYEIELKRVETDNKGDWYGLFIRNVNL